MSIYLLQSYMSVYNTESCINAQKIKFFVSALKLAYNSDAVQNIHSHPFCEAGIKAELT